MPNSSRWSRPGFCIPSPAMWKFHYKIREVFGCRSEVSVQDPIEQRLIHTCMAIVSSSRSQKQTRSALMRDMFTTSSVAWVGEGRSIVCSIGLTLIQKLLQHKKEG
jgi:hypothetical protein